MNIKDAVTGLDNKVHERVIAILQKRHIPIKEEELIKELEKDNISVDYRQMDAIINELNKRGYDISEVVSREGNSYLLVRTGKFSSPFFKASGNIEMPIIIAGDLHVGSKAFSELAWKELVSDVKKYRIRHMMLVGDIIQGLKVYSKELKELAAADIDSQLKLAENYLKMIPNSCKMHCVMGNHEEALKGQRQVGFDALKYLASVVPNLYYYGDKMDFIFNKKHRITCFHSAGGISQTTSLKAEKIWRELSEKPDILAIAHNHRLYAIARENKLLLEAGTLQRETNLVIQRGITTTVGWWIIRDFNNTSATLIKRTPEVF